MIKLYENGNALLAEYADYLNTNPYLSQWFFVDGPLITAPDRLNYAVSAGTAESPLLAIRVEPYSTVLFGHEEAAEELVEFLLTEGFCFDRYLSSETLGECMRTVILERRGFRYEEVLSMDLMEAKTVDYPSDPSVTAPTSEELPQILELSARFITDCGLIDEVDEAVTRATLPDYRILRIDGKIASMAKLGRRSGPFDSITGVYTKPEYRGQGLARRVVNSLKNEILSGGKFASLSVDKMNPISNQLYTSIGFVRVFSQGEYRLIR